MKTDPSLALAFRWACPLLLKSSVLKRIHETYERNHYYEQLAKLGVIEEAAIEEEDYKRIGKLIHAEKDRFVDVCVTDTVPGKNIAILAQQTGLDALDIEILVLLVLFKQSPLLKATNFSFGLLNKTGFCHAVAMLLHADHKAVLQRLSFSGRLLNLSLLHLHATKSAFEDKYEFTHEFEEFICDDLKDAEQIMAYFIAPTTDGALTLSDFTHIGEELDYIVPYLRHALATTAVGSNILLYGAPGTGKTELAKTLAKTLGATLYEVKTAAENHEPLAPTARLESLKAGSHLLQANGKHLLLFDEMEDVMPDSGWGGEKRVPRSKVWFNRLLEQNPIPIIWTSNHVSCIDNAYLRRFDIVLEMTAPSRQQRFNLWQRVCKEPDFQDAWLKQVSTHLPLPPSEIDRIARVVSMAESGDKSQKHARQLISHSYKAATGRTARWPNASNHHVALPYQLSWLNTDSDIEKIVKALCQHRRGRLCLYGPPGCGKTQLAHYIAQCADMPLISKKASDLISPYVGETEQNIAAAFKEAAADHAVLLIDEADSFFADRVTSRNSWETTRINELLVQLEQCDGIFIAATNRVDHFDHAAKRRFDFKVEFDYLDSKQIFDLYCQILQEKPMPDALEKLMAMKHLTPGNFAVAKRQAMLLQQHISNYFLMSILQQEAASNPHKPVNRPIGFIH